MTSKKKQRDKTVTQVTKTVPELFPDRLKGKDITMGALTLSIKSMESTIVAYIQSACADGRGQMDRIKLALMYVKYGITDIKRDGEPFGVEFDTHEIMGRKFRCIPDAILDQIPTEVIWKISNQVQDLTHLSYAEVDRLDFFTDSERAASRKIAENVTDEPGSQDNEPATE